LRPDAVDAEEQLEQLAFVRAREAEELQRVFPYDGVHLDRHLAVAEPLHRRRRVHEVADAVHVDDEPGAGAPLDATSQPRDHSVLPRQVTGRTLRAFPDEPGAPRGLTGQVPSPNDVTEVGQTLHRV